MSTITKVSKHRFRILADVPKVRHTSALRHKQQPVKLLKEHRARMENGAQDGQPGSSQSLQERQHGDRRLTVESRRGHIEKNEQISQGSYLEANTDSQP